MRTHCGDLKTKKYPFLFLSAPPHSLQEQYTVRLFCSGFASQNSSHGLAKAPRAFSPLHRKYDCKKSCFLRSLGNKQKCLFISLTHLKVRKFLCFGGRVERGSEVRQTPMRTIWYSITTRVARPAFTASRCRMLERGGLIHHKKIRYQNRENFWLLPQAKAGAQNRFSCCRHRRIQTGQARRSARICHEPRGSFQFFGRVLLFWENHRARTKHWLVSYLKSTHAGVRPKYFLGCKIFLSLFQSERCAHNLVFLF